MPPALKVPLFDTQGRQKRDLSLSPQVFGTPISEDLLSQVLIAYAANKRRTIAATKKRDEVKGGGRKPFRQKGTGRARAGSIRSPLWRGGGVVFGPSPERNYGQKIPQKMQRKALLMALAKKIKEGRFFVLESLKNVSGKTKEVVKILEPLPLAGSVLLALPKLTEAFKKASRNIPYLKVILLRDINADFLLRYQYFVTTKEGIEFLEKRYAPSAAEASRSQGASVKQKGGKTS